MRGELAAFHALDERERVLIGKERKQHPAPGGAVGGQAFPEQRGLVVVFQPQADDVGDVRAVEYAHVDGLAQIFAQVDERGHGEGEQLARAQVVEAVGQDARGEVVFAPGLILAEVAHLVERVRQALDEVFLEPGDADEIRDAKQRRAVPEALQKHHPPSEGCHIERAGLLQIMRLCFVLHAFPGFEIPIGHREGLPCGA